MKASIITVSVILWILVIGLFVRALVIDQRVDIKMANLQLADDASTPEQKAKFLRLFLADMDKAGLPEHAAWVWKSERNRVSNQRIVLESLIQRCDDIAPLNKESMGYSQGMTQITGQEFDHAINDVQHIYAKAFAMHYGWLAIHLWWVLLLPAIVTSIWGASDVFC